MNIRAAAASLTITALLTACDSWAPSDRFLALPAADRPHFLFRTIRDAGFTCERLVSAEQERGGDDLWWVACASGRIYGVTVGPGGSMCIAVLPAIIRTTEASPKRGVFVVSGSAPRADERIKMLERL